MLIDELEKASQRLQELYERLKGQEKTYRMTVDRSVREEITQTKKEIRREKYLTKLIIMDHVFEMAPLKKHFPELFNTLLEDQYIGSVLDQKKYWADAWTIKDPKTEIANIRKERKQLKDAKASMENWPGDVETKAIIATWPVLKGHLTKDTMTKEEVLAQITQLDLEKRNRGWTCLINQGLVEDIVNQYAKKVSLASKRLIVTEEYLKKSKGSGTVHEYNAMKEYITTKKKKELLEKKLSHLFLANMEYFRAFKKMGKGIKTGGFSDVSLGFIRNAYLPKFDEKEWLEEMKKRIEN